MLIEINYFNKDILRILLSAILIGPCYEFANFLRTMNNVVVTG